MVGPSCCCTWRLNSTDALVFVVGSLTYPPPVVSHGVAAITGFGKLPSRLVIGVSGFLRRPAKRRSAKSYLLPEMPVVQGHVGPSILFCTHWLRAVMVS